MLVGVTVEVTVGVTVLVGVTAGLLTGITLKSFSLHLINDVLVFLIFLFIFKLSACNITKSSLSIEIYNPIF